MKSSVKLKSSNSPNRGLFGSMKDWKIDSQKIKDEIRREENRATKRKFEKLQEK